MLEKFPTSAGYRAGILFIYVCFVAIYWVTPLYGAICVLSRIMPRIRAVMN